MKQLRNRLGALLLGVGVGLFASPSFASQPFVVSEDTPVRAAPPLFPSTYTLRGWYGYQSLVPLLISDVASIALYASTDNLRIDTNGDVVRLLMGVRPLIAPITHWANGHVGRGFLSLGIHLTLSYALAVIGYEVGDPSCKDPISCYASYSPAAYRGFAVGAGLSTLIDVAFLAYNEPLKEVTFARQKGLPFAMSVAPMLAVNQVGLGVVGRF